ncbi:hypothetical protein ACHAWC_009254 [Mediolabrus comicus]
MNANATSSWKKHKKWTKPEDDLLSREIKKYLDAKEEVDWDKIFLLFPDRRPDNVKEHWRDVLDPAIRKGRWVKSEVVTSLTMYRDLTCTNKYAAIAKRLKRARCDVKYLMKTYILPAALLNSNKEQISRVDDEFNTSANAAWAAVQQAKGYKNQVAAPPLVETGVVTLSEHVQSSNLATEKKRKRDGPKSSRERKEETKLRKSKREVEETKLNSMLFTAEDENDLADPNCKKEWVLKLRAVERKLLNKGIPKALLDNLVTHYKSKFKSGDQLLDTRMLKKSREAATKDLPFD